MLNGAIRLVALAGITCVAFPAAATAKDGSPQRDPPEEAATLGWTNATDLSFVATYGNSDTETLGFRNLLRYDWRKARFSLRVDGLRTKNADKKFVQILTLDIPPGAPAEDVFIIVDPDKKLDAEKYWIEAIYDRRVSNRLFWNVGFSWDRNKDANILNRYVGFGGLGHKWFDSDDLRFETTYALSYTDRNEETPDLEKDATFPGLRLASTYRNLWGKVTTFGHDWTSNVSLSDTEDWSFDTSVWVAVAINDHLALKVTAQWLYNSLPALQEIDILAVLPEDVEIDFGSVRIRKENLDTILTTSIVIDF